MQICRRVPVRLLPLLTPLAGILRAYLHARTGENINRAYSGCSSPALSMLFQKCHLHLQVEYIQYTVEYSTLYRSTDTSNLAPVRGHVYTYSTEQVLRPADAHPYPMDPEPSLRWSMMLRLGPGGGSRVFIQPAPFATLRFSLFYLTLVPEYIFFSSSTPPTPPTPTTPTPTPSTPTTLYH